ncbi:hypothetical protein D3C76_1737710 [compost metagenome]
MNEGVPGPFIILHIVLQGLHAQFGCKGAVIDNPVTCTDIAGSHAVALAVIEGIFLRILLKEYLFIGCILVERPEQIPLGQR